MPKNYDFASDAKKWKELQLFFENERAWKDLSQLFAYWQTGQKISMDGFRTLKPRKSAIGSKSANQTNYSDFIDLFKTHCLGEGKIDSRFMDAMKKEFKSARTTPPPPSPSTPPPPPPRNVTQYTVTQGPVTQRTITQRTTPPPRTVRQNTTARNTVPIRTRTVRPPQHPVTPPRPVTQRRPHPTPLNDRYDVVSGFVAPTLCSVAGGVTSRLINSGTYGGWRVWFWGTLALVAVLYAARFFFAVFKISDNDDNFSKAVHLAVVYEILACITAYSTTWYFCLGVAFCPFLVVIKSFSQFSRSGFARAMLAIALIPPLVTTVAFANRPSGARSGTTGTSVRADQQNTPRRSSSSARRRRPPAARGVRASAASDASRAPARAPVTTVSGGAAEPDYSSISQNAPHQAPSVSVSPASAVSEDFADPGLRARFQAILKKLPPKVSIEITSDQYPPQARGRALVAERAGRYGGSRNDSFGNFELPDRRLRRSFVRYDIVPGMYTPSLKELFQVTDGGTSGRCECLVLNKYLYRNTFRVPVVAPSQDKFDHLRNVGSTEELDSMERGEYTVCRYAVKGKIIEYYESHRLLSQVDNRIRFEVRVVMTVNVRITDRLTGYELVRTYRLQGTTGSRRATFGAYYPSTERSMSVRDRQDVLKKLSGQLMERLMDDLRRVMDNNG